MSQEFEILIYITLNDLKRRLNKDPNRCLTHMRAIELYPEFRLWVAVGGACPMWARYTKKIWIKRSSPSVPVAVSDIENQRRKNLRGGPLMPLG